MLSLLKLTNRPNSRQHRPPRCRFWNETEQLLGLFERFREANEHANAIPCFGRMARYRFNELLDSPNYDPTKKSIISAFQPKSGGTYLHNRLFELGYHEFWWLYHHRLCPSVCYASDEALRYFMMGGFACHTHARPDANILAALDQAGVQKIWVHLRNPAESVVSSYYHYLGEGHGEGVVAEERVREALVEAPRQGLSPTMTKSEFVVKHIGWHIDWVAEWLRFAQSRSGLVVFSYYKEIAEPRALIARVFNELGAGQPGEFTPQPLPGDRYREKGSADWRSDLSPEAQTYLELRVWAELQLFPAFEQLWT